MATLLVQKNSIIATKFKKSLESCLADLNNEFQAVLASKLSITLGDEFQGLLSLDAPLFQIIDRINLAMKPYQVRFGIGMGKILTDINPEQSIGADGPAYWHARKAINYIHQKMTTVIHKLRFLLMMRIKSISLIP